ncbi:MAG: 4Fe-4S binding protein [Desulfitobacterium sp.]
MKRNNTRMLRMATMAVVMILVVIGGVWGAGTGTLSAFGLKSISAICPLGYLETVFASRTIMPRLLISFLVIAGLTVILGKVFCAWICPVPLVRYGLTNKTYKGQKTLTDNPDVASSSLSIKKEEVEESSCPHRGSALNTGLTRPKSPTSLGDGCQRAVESSMVSTNVQRGLNPPLNEVSFNKDSTTGLTVLGVTLASSAIVGFPVFCLICPIGLIFATLFSIMRLLQFNEPTFDLIIFPIVIIIELVFFKKWCSKWCPVGALLGIFCRFNRRIVPTVDSSLCLEETNHVSCQRCRSACSLDIDPKSHTRTSDISDCTKCKECADQCPVRAIKFPWKRRS